MCSSGVASLKMAVCLCMMIRGVEDLQLTYEIVEKIEIMLRDNRRLIVDELSAMFPQISRSLLHETITETFGYRKMSARWAPKQLTDQNKINRVEAKQEFLRHYKLHGD